ncbi:MAG TPA: hypothetical protein VIJ18_10600 [Microbacteriaceae bacterium]
MQLFLTIVSGLACTIVYIESIRLGFKYKTYAMSSVALFDDGRVISGDDVRA